jgi:Xaa-Pro dipeptidase
MQETYMRQEMIGRLRRAMDEEHIDVIVAVSPENFAYTAGFVVPSQSIMRWRHAMAVVTRDGQEALVVVDMEETTVRSRAPDAKIRVWGEFTERPMSALARLVKDMDVAEGRIGIEMDYLPAGDLEDLRVLLPLAQFTAVEGIFARLRQVKTQDEIALIRRLSGITDEAVGEALCSVRAGMTELDLAGVLLKGLYARGAEHFKLLIVASGERSEFPNVGPSNRVLSPGDPLRVEIFGIIGGYHAAVCRTAVVRKASPEIERIWRNLVECKYLVLGMIRPGAGTGAIYNTFLKKFGELNLPPISFVGHGMGLHLHEEPYLGKYSDSRLEAGMVLGVEPLVYGWGRGFGLQIKDTVLVTPEGCEVLSDRTKNDDLIIIP